MSQSSRLRIMKRVRRGQALTVQDLRRLTEAWEYDGHDHRLEPGSWWLEAIDYLAATGSVDGQIDMRRDADAFIALVPGGICEDTRIGSRGFDTPEDGEFLSRTGSANCRAHFPHGVGLETKAHVMDNHTNYPRAARSAIDRARRETRTSHDLP